MRRLLVLSVLGVAVLVGLGCNASLPPVEVKVTLDGNPLEGATVTLVPDDSSMSDRPVGLSDASGVAKITTGSRPGAPKGKYKVTVTKMEKTNIPGAESGEMDPAKAMQMFTKNQGMRPGMGPGPGQMGPKNLLPVKYGDPAQSGLTVDVPTSGTPTLALVSDGK